jgi:hypothetical protein
VGLGKDFSPGYGLLQGFTNVAVFSLFFLRNYYVSFFPFLLSLLILPLCRPPRLRLFALQLSAVAITAVWTLYDGHYFMYGPRFLYEAVPILCVLYGATFALLFRLFPPRWSRALPIAILAVWLGNIAVFEAQWVGLRPAEFGGIAYVPSTIRELQGFNYTDGRMGRLYRETKGSARVFLMRKRDWWFTGEGIWLNTFPLERARPLFLTRPDDYRGEIPRAEKLDWDRLPPTGER